jgi:hypothetical protein
MEEVLVAEVSRCGILVGDRAMLLNMIAHRLKQMEARV